MGQCQSRSIPVGERHIVSKQNDGRGVSKPKLFIALLSPSNQSTSTLPETPSPQFSTTSYAQSPSVFPKLLSLEEEEEEKHQDVGFSLFAFAETPSLVGGVVGSAIKEEESLGAPSDEESFHETQKQRRQPEEEEFKQQAPMYNSGDPRPDSARRLYKPQSSKQQSQVKLLRSHVTSPKSIIHRPSLVAPPKGLSDGLHNKSRTSVNPHTIADFNKLKVQVQLARRAEKHRRRKAKLEDRLQDVQGYRDLWHAYEEIGHMVSTANQDAAPDSASATKDARPVHERSKSLDLKQPSTWYFDFQGLEDFIVVDDDDEGYRSQSSLSLLSEASMEVQRRLFAEKRRSRRQQRPRKGQSLDEKRSDISVSSRNSAASSCRSDFSPSFDYGPGNSLADLEVLVTDDDSTPRARSRRRRGSVESDDASRGTDDRSCCSDLDGENDYKVPRRRRHTRHQADDSSLSTFDDRSYDTLRGFRGDPDLGYYSQFYTTEEKPTPTSIRVKKKIQPVPTAKDQYGFDPSAPLFLQMETLNLPSVEIADAITGQVRWRQFPDSNDGVGPGHATRSLETQYDEVSTYAFQRSYRTEKDTIDPNFDNLVQDLHCLVGAMSTRETMGMVETKPSMQIPEEQGITKCLTHEKGLACCDDQVGRVAGNEVISIPNGNRDPLGSVALHRAGQDDFTWTARGITWGHEATSRTLQSSPRNKGDKNRCEIDGIYSPPVGDSKRRRSGASETCGSLVKEYDPAIDHLSTEQFLLISSPAIKYPDSESVDEEDQPADNPGDGAKPERHAGRRQWMEKKRGESRRQQQPHGREICSPLIAQMSTEEFWLISANHNIVQQASDIDTESAKVEPDNQTLSVEAIDIELVKINGAAGGEFLVNNTNQTAIEDARLEASSPRTHAPSQGRSFEDKFEPLPTGLERNDDLAAQVTEKLDLLLAKFRSNGAGRLVTSGIDEDPCPH